MSNLRVIAIVSSDPSDLYFANRLMQEVNVVGVVVEDMTPKKDPTPLFVKALRLFPNPMALLNKLHEKIIEKIHLAGAAYARPENAVDFGNEGRRLFPVDKCTVKYTSQTENINNSSNVEWIKKLEPDLIALCGASILKKGILSVPTKGVLNLHGGLSQQYRGLFTTEWAILNEQPEYVGATVHYVSLGIDDGDIVFQGRPQIESDDTPHTLYEKVVRLGVDMMSRAIRDIEAGTSARIPLTQRGALYTQKMFTRDIQNATWKKVQNGVIVDYLKSKTVRDKPVLESMINDYSILTKKV